MSTDSGATFGNTINLSSNDGESYYPKIAILNNNVYIIWNDNSFGDFEISYRKSIDDGATFESPVNLSNSDEMSITPTVTALIAQNTEKQ